VGSDAYKDYLCGKDAPWHLFDGAKDTFVGPLPWITEAAKAAGQDPPKNLIYNDILKLLSYNGTTGALLLPSLEMALFHECLGYPEGELDSLTILAGVNSDSYNRGLGLVIEPPPGPGHGANGSVSLYNGLGLTPGTDRNAIKFHPDMHGGQLRIEGRGGFFNSNIGFTPKGWTSSKHWLQGLEITLSRSGNNTLKIQSPDGGPNWSRSWQHKLLGGPQLPSVYAWLDLGGQAGKPLIIGPISLVMRRGEASTSEKAEAFINSNADEAFEWH